MSKPAADYTALFSRQMRPAPESPYEINRDGSYLDRLTGRRGRSTTTAAQLLSARRFFAVTRVTAKSGAVLKIDSDGRAGDGYTHTRLVYRGRKLVAALDSSGTGAGACSVTLAGGTGLRLERPVPFATLLAALTYLKLNF